ncbi:MAG: 7-carboxy-7-deazaguanine synthase QueE [Acidiferrobacterales bacterium]|nr:7-carboxy-7-deazaguanine synthase QueE [Acidiferrobacterales bacterium]
MTTRIRISEIFGPTIQGEGLLIGQPTVFVRTGGCDYRCSWCDTLYAVESQYLATWKSMSPQEIWQEVFALSGGAPLTVTLSGGNPATQPLGELIALGQSQGFQFALETQGSVCQSWFANLNVLTLSPKPPSSGMETDWKTLNDCIESAGDNTRTVMKIVVFDEEDYDYAKQVYAQYSNFPIYLQPGNHTPPSDDEETEDAIDLAGITNRLDWLVNKVTEDQWFDAHVLPQLHVMIWGNTRGV